MNYQRRLLIVPILHTKEDMGSLGSRLPAKDGYISMASSFWREVKEKVCQLLSRSENIKVYQDGLPHTKEEILEKILNEVKSPNYELLRFLKDRGAKILGTEDPKLLKEEYKFVSQILRARDQGNTSDGGPKRSPSCVVGFDSSEVERSEKLFRGGIKRAVALLTKRDAYIANRIDKTLSKGDLGILFLGAAHKIQTRLPKDIQVEIL